MILRPRTFLFLVAIIGLLQGCGFHLRKEAQLPAAMQRVHIEIADLNNALGKDLSKALARSGAQVVENAEAGVAVLKIPVNTLSTDVLSVGGTARANEYALRYHVEFSVQGGDGTVVVPKQTIELSREFTFDATQALGVASETDLLSKELERDMVQTILRRLEALGKIHP
ncbi:MAG: LPS assembly lipoprotein LptE [Dokdonella sp.]|uniref:LPS-assembly lipoprotein LptE n=1 Tax=Dokdonella sp. TaxID=2291710 RepID=UPI00326346AA